ncbi:MAG: hypothetical protein AAF570_00405 [Bacteroidota bacterium]
MHAQENQKIAQQKQAQSASMEASGGSAMSPPQFKLEASNASAPVQRQTDPEKEKKPNVFKKIGNWFKKLFKGKKKKKQDGVDDANEVETTATTDTTNTTNESEVALETDTVEAEATEQTREEEIAELLQAHYDGFAAIEVNVPNPDPTTVQEQPTLQAEVRPPYMINSGDWIADAQANRAQNSQVNALINTYPWGFRHGKASSTNIQSFLQAAIDQDLTADNTSAGLRTFLDTYGIGVDCSGFASQGYNMLTDEMGLDAEQMNVNDTGSGRFRDTDDRFDSVDSPADLRPGDALYLDNPNGINHVRMVQNVTATEERVDFVTIESTASNSGPRQRHWRFTDPTSFDSLQVSTDGGATYADSTEDQEFARFSALYPAEEENETTEGGGE